MPEYTFNSLIRQRTESKPAQKQIQEKAQKEKAYNAELLKDDISTFEEVQGYNSSYVNKNSLFDDIDCEFEYTGEDNDKGEDKNIFE